MTTEQVHIASYDALVLGRLLLFPPANLPDELTDRAVPVLAVHLRRNESPASFGERLVWPLDPDDVEVLTLIARGVPTRQIAVETCVSLRTAQRQIARLRRKLGIEDTADLREYLRRRGFDI